MILENGFLSEIFCIRRTIYNKTHLAIHDKQILNTHYKTYNIINVEPMKPGLFEAVLTINLSIVDQSIDQSNEIGPNWAC